MTAEPLAIACGHIGQARGGLRYIVDESGAVDFVNAALLDAEDALDAMGVLPHIEANIGSVHAHLKAALVALESLGEDDRVRVLAKNLSAAAGECRRW